MSRELMVMKMAKLIDVDEHQSYVDTVSRARWHVCLLILD